jgi:hypothetical protein
MVLKGRLGGCRDGPEAGKREAPFPMERANKMVFAETEWRFHPIPHSDLSIRTFGGISWRALLARHATFALELGFHAEPAFVTSHLNSGFVLSPAPEHDKESESRYWGSITEWKCQ